MTVSTDAKTHYPAIVSDSQKQLMSWDPHMFLYDDMYYVT